MEACAGRRDLIRIAGMTVILLGLILLSLFAAAWVHMCLSAPKGKRVRRPVPDKERAEIYARKLSRMLQYDTVSKPEYNAEDLKRFRAFQGELERLFPQVHARLECFRLDGNLLYFWKGKSHDRPLVLMSHQDTVPAEGEWKYGPFSGAIAEGSVWGRGACDTKCSVMGFLQAVEELLEEGYEPEQDLYLSSSCTEEVSGDGCPKIVRFLKERGVRPFLVCDEGGGIMEDPVPGVRGSFAMAGMMEKGMANVHFHASGNGGHASTPLRGMPVARTADFVHWMEHCDPFRKRMEKPVREMLRRLAPYGILPVRYVFSNLWLFGPLVAEVMPRLSPHAAAMLQSTIAFTQIAGSDANNMFPKEVILGANLRFIPHQDMEETLGLVEKIAAKYGLEMEVVSAEPSTAVSETEGEAWELFSRVARETFPEAPVCPYILTGGTDARFYQDICPHVYRFAPVVLGPEQKAGIHGIDEHISTDCLPGCVDFYKNLIRANR